MDKTIASCLAKKKGQHIQGAEFTCLKESIDHRVGDVSCHLDAWESNCRGEICKPEEELLATDVLGVY